MRKKKNIELDVDFIDGSEPLTDVERDLLSKYFADRKIISQKLALPNKSSISPLKKKLKVA